MKVSDNEVSEDLAIPNKGVQISDIPNKPIDAKRFSKNAIKRLRAMTKDQLVQMISNLSNYAEAQKAANIMLSNAIKELQVQRAKELESMAVPPEDVPEEMFNMEEESK
jgi:hypothetical protein